MSRLNIPHVEYRIMISEREPYCLCSSFTDTENEFIPSWCLMESCRMREGETLYGFAKRAHSDYGLVDVEQFFERMIVVNYLMANEDRHFGNLGILRDSESLEPLRFAPIFDTGSSLVSISLPSGSVKVTISGACRSRLRMGSRSSSYHLSTGSTLIHSKT